MIVDGSEGATIQGDDSADRFTILYASSSLFPINAPTYVACLSLSPSPPSLTLLFSFITNTFFHPACLVLLERFEADCL